MNGLSGTRVIIVDDEEKEAIPMLKGLSKMGIPAVYFDGTPDTLPNELQRLSGVRLAILDMDLLGGGVPSEKAKVSALLAYLIKILTPDNGPYGVLLWTKHPELQELFENLLFAEENIPNPIFVITLTKTECQDANNNIDFRLVFPRIQIELNKFSPLLILQTWEEKSFLAATQVTNELSSLTSGDSKNLTEWRSLWNTKFLQLLRTMAEAEAGKQLNSNSWLSALYGSLNPLHSDRMESNISEVYPSLSHYSDGIMTATVSTDLNAKAKLNTMLHLATDAGNHFYAGNIYTDLEKVQFPLIDELLNDFVIEHKDRDKFIAALIPLSKSVVIEVNASCDHSQNNIRIARFITGLLLPATESKKIKNAGFIHKLGPVFLKSPTLTAEKYYFFFSSRHLLTTELNRITEAKVFARLRGQAFADLQSWLAYQTSRPGKLMLTE